MAGRHQGACHDGPRRRHQSINPAALFIYFIKKQSYMYNHFFAATFDAQIFGQRNAGSTVVSAPTFQVGDACANHAQRTGSPLPFFFCITPNPLFFCNEEYDFIASCLFAFN